MATFDVAFRGMSKYWKYFYVIGTGACTLNNVYLIIKIPELSTKMISLEPPWPVNTCSVLIKEVIF